MNAITGRGNLVAEAEATGLGRTGQWELSCESLRTAIQRYVDGVVDLITLRNWADALELNDRVTYQAGAEDIIAEVLFLLTTPEANGPFEAADALRLLSGRHGNSEPLD